MMAPPAYYDPGYATYYAPAPTVVVGAPYFGVGYGYGYRGHYGHYGHGHR